MDTGPEIGKRLAHALGSGQAADGALRDLEVEFRDEESEIDVIEDCLDRRSPRRAYRCVGDQRERLVEVLDVLDRSLGDREAESVSGVVDLHFRLRHEAGVFRFFGSSGSRRSMWNSFSSNGGYSQCPSKLTVTPADEAVTAIRISVGTPVAEIAYVQLWLPIRRLSVS